MSGLPPAWVSYCRSLVRIEEYNNNATMVDAIISDKRGRGGKWTMAHPDAPDLEAATLYLVWGGSGIQTDKERGQQTRMSGEVEYDASKGNKEIVSALLSPTASKQPLNTNASPLPLTSSTTTILEKAEAAAAEKIKAARKSELEEMQWQREQRKSEMDSKKTPEDKKRAEITKLANLVAAKIRQLQTAEVSITELKNVTPEEQQYKALAQSSHRSLQHTLMTLRADVDATVALGRRATLTILETKVADGNARFTYGERVGSPALGLIQKSK